MDDSKSSHVSKKDNDYQGKGGSHYDKYKIECYRCGNFGHYKSECYTKLPKEKGEKSNFAEKKEEETLLMAFHALEEYDQETWYVDTSCSNHVSARDCEMYDPKRGSIAVVNDSWRWHYRYGHLNLNGLRTLHQKKMVTGLPEITPPSKVCEECITRKHQGDSFPSGKVVRAQSVLEEKSEAFDAFKSFKALAENETDKKIKTLRTD
ncbi:unnamed protein product [Prunus armeniaca]